MSRFNKHVSQELRERVPALQSYIGGEYRKALFSYREELKETLAQPNLGVEADLIRGEIRLLKILLEMIDGNAS